MTTVLKRVINELASWREKETPVTLEYWIKHHLNENGKKGNTNRPVESAYETRKDSDAAFRSGGSYMPLKQSGCWGSGAVNEETMQCD